MPSRFTTTRRVAFAETDMAGIVHFANFYRYMEEAEHDFFRSLGRSVMEHRPDGSILGWPRVSAKCSFKAPAKFEDEIAIEVGVDRIGVKSLTLRYDFRRGETRLALGEMKIVCCVFRHGREMESVPLPPDLVSLLEEIPHPDDGSRYS